MIKFFSEKNNKKSKVKKEDKKEKLDSEKKSSPTKEYTIPYNINNKFTKQKDKVWQP